MDRSLAETLFSKSRRAVLALLFGQPDQQFYLRQIVRASGCGVGAIQRELKQLAEAGIIQRTVRHKQVYFQANAACPIFAELNGILVKTAGAADVLRAALTIGCDNALVNQLDAFRKKRNISDYERAGSVSQREAEEVFALARQLRVDLLAWLKRDHPELVPPGW